MATIRKRGTTYTAEVRRKGISKSATFTTKAAATAWALQVESDIVAGKNGATPDKTFSDLLTHYVNTVTPTKAGAREETLRINRFLADPIAAVHLRDLNTTHFAAWRDRRLASVSAGSVLRERNTLSNACKRAVEEWKWLTVHPMKGVVWPDDPDPRDRTATDDELERLLFVLGEGTDTVNGRLCYVVRFALETAMRESEIARLEWSDIELKFCRVRFGKTRAAKREVPLSPTAIGIIQAMPRDKATVFDISASQIDAQYRAAREKAMVDDLTFHDLRHTAVTRLAKKLDVMALARMIGHTNLKTLMIYYNPKASDLADLL